MKRWSFWQLFALCGLIVGVQSARATEIGLADWCINVNGSVDATNPADNPSNGCNGGTNSPFASISLSNFDTTLEPGANALGTATQSVSITLTPGQENYVAFYADYDVDYNTYGSFDDSATAVNAVPANWSYELDNPETSNLFGDFAATNNSTPLANSNNVGTPSGPPTQCCDAAWAMAIDNINVLAGGSGNVTFIISTTAPTSGFYLQQTNATTSDSIYLSAVVSVQNPVGGVPEPSTFALGLGAAGVTLALARRKRVRA